MPDDQNQPQNPTPEENSIPPSPQEPTKPAPENTAHSEPAEVPPEALESSPNDFSAKSNDIPPSNSTPTEAEKESITEEKQASNEPSPEPVSEPIEAPESGTAQISTNEPLKSKLEELPPASSEPKPRTSAPTEATPPVVSSFNHMRELQAKEQLAIQNKKRKKLDLILTLFAKRKNITNDEVEKFLHVSDATATRYLSILEKEGKIKQNGKTGHMVSYSRI